MIRKHENTYMSGENNGLLTRSPVSATIIEVRLNSWNGLGFSLSVPREGEESLFFIFTDLDATLGLSCPPSPPSSDVDMLLIFIQYLKSCVPQLLP